jgi:hypothetical protein
VKEERSKGGEEREGGEYTTAKQYVLVMLE